jgi:prenyltransferase beta subunit
MSETARCSRELLVDESAHRIASFVLSRLNDDGGFRGRTRESDLYYTLFGLECLRALDCDFPVDRIAEYLHRFGDRQGIEIGDRPDLDFVHLVCLARCLAKLPDSAKHTDTARVVLANLEKHRSLDGGYRLTHDAPHDSIYASFLAYLAYEDAGMEINNPGGLVRCIESLRTEDGAYADRPGVSAGTTTVTAAAVVLLRYLGEDVDPSVGKWLVDRFSPGGGFKAAKLVPAPDLLSTATALYALKTMNYPMAAMASMVDPSLAFIEDVWHETGGFCGHLLDDVPDCEYTFYGLLGLGILTLAGGGE